MTKREATRARALELHAKGEPHIVIQQRLGLTKQGLQNLLKTAGLSGKSARQTGEAASLDC